jgi:hypothetical protein
MANIRVSELALITAPEVAVNDLFLLADVSEIESKKLSALELTAYMQSAITSSVSSSHSLTASYLLYQGFPNGTASYALLAKTSSYNLSSSHAIWADTASHALYAKSASYALTSSYAISSSYSATSSVQLTYSSAYADYARTASFLLYTGIPNGTASYAISSEYLIYKGIPNGTASHALVASNSTNSTTASYAISASYSVSSSYLTWTQGKSNGTASYALTSSISSLAARATLVSKPMLYGIYTASAYTPSGSSLNVTFGDSNNLASPSIITAYGTAKYNYTGSFTGSFALYANVAGFSPLLLDSSSFDFVAGGGTEVSGTMYVPFTFTGQSSTLVGPNLLYLTGSPNIYIDQRRAVKFRVESQKDGIYLT